MRSWRQVLSWAAARRLAAAAVLCAGPGLAWAMSPHLAGTSPVGAQRGTVTEITLQGERLADAQELLWYSPGIEVLRLEVPTNQASRVKAQLRIQADCRLGEHAFRLRCASGLSDLRTFWIGPFPIVQDNGTNTDSTQAQPVALNVTVEGVVENEGVHYYRVEAKAGQRLSAEVEGMRLGRALFDPFVAILDPAGFVVSASDDTALLLQDPACSLQVPKDGAYLVQLRESSYGGNADCRFRLHLGSYPRPTGLLPAGGQAGELVSVRWLSRLTNEFSQTLKLPAVPEEHLALVAEADGLGAPSPNWLRVSPFPNVLEVEPNDDKDHATPVGTNTPVALNGVIEKNGDADWFRFSAAKGQVLDIEVYGRRLRSPLDSVLELFDAAGAPLASNDDAAGADSALRFTAPAAGDFRLRVSDHLKQGGPDFFYRVELAPVTAALTLKVPDAARNNAQERKSIVVARGNRFALLVQAERRNFGGELELQVPGLPAGMSFQCDRLPGNQTVLPVVFTAAAEAPVGGKLCDLTAATIDPALKVTGRLRQDFVFVRGEPNDSVYAQTVVDKIAAAVAEAVPFKLEVIEPKVPLVRGGTLDLKVVVERQPGFDEPITVRMIYNPPGVGSANELVLAKGETRGEYRLNAAGDAELRPWKIALLASAPVGGGTAWVSSPLATLKVAEPFVAMKIEMASAEPGQSARVLCQLEQRVPFEGKATCKLLGLPNGATAPEGAFTKDDKQIVFDVATTAATPVGQHKSLFCAVTIQRDGEPILHSVGGGGCLRIDAPKPAPAVAAAPAAAPAPAPTKPVEKPLSRLEKLRLEHAAAQTKPAEPGSQ